MQNQVIKYGISAVVRQDSSIFDSPLQNGFRTALGQTYLHFLSYWTTETVRTEDNGFLSDSICR